MMDGNTKTKEPRRDSNSLAEDTISELPDAILTCILSFLPTKNVVSTCILSKRWKSIWTFVPTLSADIQCNDPHLLPREDNFLRFVDRALIDQKMTCLEKIDISYFGLEQAHVSSWISAAAKLDVRTLKFSVSYPQEIDYELPSCLFTMKNIVTLKLGLCVFLSFPVVSAFFPNLKELDLSGVVYDGDESIPNLISSCPVVEEFSILRYGDADNLETLNVSSRSLKRFSLFYCMSEDDIYHVPEIIIDCPAVECITIQDDVTGEYVVRDLSSLISANINFPYNVVHVASRFPRVVFELLNAISNVKRLSITDAAMPIFSIAHGEMLPTFPNVTWLKFCAYQEDEPIQWNVKWIIDFLKNTPKLEVLIFEGFSFFGEKIHKFDKSEGDVPKCLITNLKTIEINGFVGENDMEKIGYFLENSKVLENITINRRGGEEEIKKLPCSSKSCRISVS